VTTPQEVTAFLHAEIPQTRSLGIVVEQWDGQSLRIATPLNINRNHEGTAFGGSISTTGIVAGWTWVMLQLKAHGLEGRLVIGLSETQYHKPIDGDFVARCPAGVDDLERFIRSVSRRGRGRIRVRTEISKAGPVFEVAAVHEGVYVVAERE